MKDRALGTVLNVVLAAIGVGVSVYFGRYSARLMAERRGRARFLRVRQVLSKSGLDIDRFALASSRNITSAETPFGSCGRPNLSVPIRTLGMSIAVVGAFAATVGRGDVAVQLPPWGGERVCRP